MIKSLINGKFPMNESFIAGKNLAGMEKMEFHHSIAI